MSTDLNPRYSFESFVVGASNQVASSAAKSVAESPGSSYNPLFIYGPTGLGKTHLLMAVGNLSCAMTEGLSVEYVTLDEFIEALGVAMATGQAESFRRRFEEVDLLLVDDVQFLSHRGEVQTELLRLMTGMLERGRQVVLTSDTAPSEIEDIDDRLITRFDGGLLVDVTPPDYDTRLAILVQHAEERAAEFAEGVLEAVADFDVENVRALLGLLNRLAAFQAVSETAVTPEAAKAMLDWEVPAVEASLPETSVSVSEVDEDPFGMVPIVDFPEADEFSDFLADVSSAVEEQVEAWRERLARAVFRWQPEGYRTARLEQVMESDEVAAPVEQVIAQYEADVERLRTMREAIREVAPERANDPVFFDPDRVKEAEQLVQAAVREVGPLPKPSEAWSPKDFVESDANRVAITAVRAAVEEPGQRYNPLVFLGPPGVGKTHLLHVMGHGLQDGDVDVACLSTQQFLDELQQAVDGDIVDALRARFQRVGALLFDDLQLLSGKSEAQEEFFYIFNRLFESGRQLGVTLNGPPAEMDGLDDRIKSRLEGGLVVSLEQPDRELRRVIVLRLLEDRYGAAEEDLVDYLAARPASSVRAVIGLVQRVLSEAEARGAAPSGSLARELIEGVIPTHDGGRTIRTSGITSAPGQIHSPEKVVWRWPDPAERIMEELV